MRAGTVIGFPGVAHPLTVTHDVGGPSGVNIHGVQLAGGVRAHSGNAVVSSSVVQGGIWSNEDVLLNSSLVQDTVESKGKVTVTDSTIHGATKGHEVLLDRALVGGAIHARNLDLTGSTVLGAALLTGHANVLSSTLVALHTDSCGFFRDVTIGVALHVSSTAFDLVIVDSSVPSIIFGENGSTTNCPNIFLRDGTIVRGLIKFIGPGGTVFVESGAQFTGEVENGVVVSRRGNRSCGL